MYYLGQGDIPVKPVTRRVTFTRGQAPKVCQKYLQRQGRKPLNRRAYPTMGTPISADLSMQPGHFGDVNDPILLSVKTRAGRKFVTRVYDPASSVSLGASILDPIAPFVTAFTPSDSSVPSVIAAPVSAPSTVWNPINSLLSLWNERPQVLKDIRLAVNPNQVMQAAQSVVNPGQVSGFVNLMRQWGLSPSYQNVPVTGAMAGAGYRVAGLDLQAMTPWIIGGGVLLFIVPMLLGKHK
jgi:hypothetical protein